MKNFVIVFLFLAAFSVTALASVYDQSSFSSLGMLYQNAPVGHTEGKDNAPGHGTHHPGEDCGKCHRVGGRAESHLFTMSGTLYRDRSGEAPMAGGEIILADREGNIISMTSNASGNFWTYAPVASDPYTVGTTHGHEPFVPLYALDEEGNLTQPADPEDPRTWKYKTWAMKGNSSRPMVSIASVGGGTATTTRMSCNMHHGGVSQQRGALWVGRGPTLKSYPEFGLSYRKHIYPILRSNCAPCHIPGRSMTSMNTKTDLESPSTAVDYSGGLDLMTYEGSDVEVPIYHPSIPYKVIGYETVSKVGVRSAVDVYNPQDSLLLQKVAHGALHGGGRFWNERHPDYLAMERWIKEGALNN